MCPMAINEREMEDPIPFYKTFGETLKTEVWLTADGLIHELAVSGCKLNSGYLPIRLKYD